MVSNASRAGKEDPRFARGAATPPSRTSAPPSSTPKRDDTQLLTDALESYEALLAIGGGQVLAQAEATATPAPIGAEIDATRALIRSLRGFLASRGADALFTGPAQAGMLGLARAAIECHLEQLQASAEMLLACEFGDVVLGQPDHALQALARRMDPLYDAACALQQRLAASTR